MDFLKFAELHGLMIRTLYDDCQWHRCPTADHPKKQNGAYKFCGSHGFVQNHATMAEVATWKSDRPVNVQQYSERAKKALEETRSNAEQAAKKAALMLMKAKPMPHDYFFLKGFPDHKVMVLEKDDQKIALLPMRVGDKLTSLQIISFQDMKWRKTFLRGGITKGATFRIGKGRPILCEGFATALSVDKALRKANMQAQVVVCYSAHNMAHIAQQDRPMLVIADNDESGTGQTVAEKIGAPYWISKTTGNDFNDDHLQRGDFAMMQDIKKMMMKCN